MTNTANNEIGSKYQATRELDIADVAKLVRADIAAAIKAGELPAGIKCSVSIQRYAGGQSLSIGVKAFPHLVVPPELTAYYAAGDFSRGYEGRRLTGVAEAARAKLEAIRQAYNYDRSDVMVDYHDVRFYGDVSFHCGEA